MSVLVGEIPGMTLAGEWDEVLERAAEVRRLPSLAGEFFSEVLAAVHVYVERGNVSAARELLEANAAGEHSEDIQVRTDYAWAKGGRAPRRGGPGGSSPGGGRGRQAGTSSGATLPESS